MLRAVRAIKKAVPGLAVMTDIALDPYTTHGHDGVLTAGGGDVDNDRTVAILARMAVLHARAGVDLVAPSDMMDGRVGAIRRALDSAGFERTGIMAYSAKFASSYYGPFRGGRERKGGAGKGIDKSTYQLNPANRREALVEAGLDEAEGADILMVKPAGPYLDIIRDLRSSTERPVAAYQVSGEYSQICAAARLGWLDLAAARRESLARDQAGWRRHDPHLFCAGDGGGTEERLNRSLSPSSWSGAGAFSSSPSSSAPCPHPFPRPDPSPPRRRDPPPRPHPI